KVLAVVICGVDGFRVGVVDDSGGVVIRPLLPSVYSCRKDRIVLGLPFDLLDSWLARCADGKPILEILVADPLLREERPRNEQGAGCGDESHYAHERLLPPADLTGRRNNGRNRSFGQPAGRSSKHDIHAVASGSTEAAPRRAFFASRRQRMARSAGSGAGCNARFAVFRSTSFPFLHPLSRQER